MNYKSKELAAILNIIENPGSDIKDYKALQKTGESLVSAKNRNVLASYFCWKLKKILSAREFVGEKSSELLSSIDSKMDEEGKDPMKIVLGQSYGFNNYILPKEVKRKTFFINLWVEFEADFANQKSYLQACEDEEKKNADLGAWLLDEYEKEAGNMAGNVIAEIPSTEDPSKKVLGIYESIKNQLLIGAYSEAIKLCWEHEIVDESIGRLEFFESDLFWDLVRNELSESVVERSYPNFRDLKNFISEIYSSHDGPLWGDRSEPHSGEIILALAVSEMENQQLIEFVNLSQRSDFFAVLSACLLMRERPLMAARIFAEKCTFSPKFSCLMVMLLSNAIPDLGGSYGDHHEALQTLLDLSCNTPLWSSQNGQEQQRRSLHCILGGWLRLGESEKAWETLEIYIDSSAESSSANKKPKDENHGQSACWIQAALYFFQKQDREMALATLRDYLLRFALL